MMPRFGVSFEDKDHGFSTPEIFLSGGIRRQSNREAEHYSGNALPPALSAKEQTSKSVRLSCVSPDGRQWHSVIRRERKYVLLSRAIEDGGDTVQQSSLKAPPTLEVVLPESIQSVLSIDPPLELFCVEAEGTELTKLKLRYNDKRIGIPRLCIYSITSLFVFQAAFDNLRMENLASNENPVVKGEVVSMVQPFEEYLQSNYSTRIVRARPAPQRWMGYAVHSPAGCIIMLTEDRANNEYHVVCLESKGQIKRPTFSFGLEQITGGMNRIVDFCFAQSTGLSLLSSLSMLLLKASGDVLAASPFVFDGTLVPRLKLQETMDFLHVGLQKLERSQPKWRQYRAAQQFLTDVFPLSDRQTHYVAAKTSSRCHAENASAWPIRLQGPIIFRNEQEEFSSSDVSYAAIENFGRSDLVGFAVGDTEGRIDFGVTSPTTLIPRFAFESRNDAFALDDVIFQSSAWVERVGLGLESSDALSLTLHQDPNFDSILHFVSNNLVASINSNCIRCAISRIQDSDSTLQVSTDAWGNLEQPSLHSSVQGIVSCADSVAGHKLFIQLCNGHFQAVNVSHKKASRDLQKLQGNGLAFRGLSLGDPLDSNVQNGRRTSDALGSNAPFHDVAPLQIAKVNKGLASLAKLGGTHTRCDEINPEMLAIVAAIQERCENEVVLPVLELAKMVKKRREALQTLIKNQTDQITKLLEVRKEIELRNVRIHEALVAAEANALHLKDRANAAHEACKDLLPTVTEAELEFFHFVELMDARVKIWEANFRELVNKVRERCEALAGESIPDGVLDSEVTKDLRKITDDTGRRLINTRQALKETEHRLHAVLRKAGIEAPSENVPSNIKPL